MWIKLQNPYSEQYIFAHKYSLFYNENTMYFPKALISLQLSHLLITKIKSYESIYHIKAGALNMFLPNLLKILN